MMTTWRLLDGGSRSGAWNMACDAALLDAHGGDAPPTLRFFSWSRPAVSLGRHQPDPDPEAASTINDLGLDWVRRPTGGRAVFHGREAEELTYSIVAPLDRGPLAGPPRQAYRRIHSGLATGLRDLGVSADLAAPGPQAVGPASRLACFAVPVPGEITAGGRKLVGSAQRICRRRLLQHGSIPLAGGSSILERVWPGSLPPGSATTLAEQLGRSIGGEETAAALAAALARGLNISLVDGVLSSHEQRWIERLSQGGEAVSAPAVPACA